MAVPLAARARRETAGSLYLLVGLKAAIQDHAYLRS
jgi:hypothetical protein